MTQKLRAKIQEIKTKTWSDNSGVGGEEMNQRQ
jgi:hypothetical protein